MWLPTLDGIEGGFQRMISTLDKSFRAAVPAHHGRVRIQGGSALGFALLVREACNPKKHLSPATAPGQRLTSKAKRTISKMKASISSS